MNSPVIFSLSYSSSTNCRFAVYRPFRVMMLFFFMTHVVIVGLASSSRTKAMTGMRSKFLQAEIGQKGTARRGNFDAGAKIRKINGDPAGETMFETAMRWTTFEAPEEHRNQFQARRLRETILTNIEFQELGKMGKDAGTQYERRLDSGSASKKYLGLQSPPLDMTGPSMADVNATAFRFASVNYPSSVDWRATMFMTPVQSQYYCESCWAVAAVDSVAIMWAIIKRTTPVLLSTQQICDCATIECCEGGWPEWAFAYILFNGGITSDQNYPYLAKDGGFCLTTSNSTASNSTNVVAQITGWETVPERDPISLMKAVSMQPVLAFINANAKDFQMYINLKGTTTVYNGTCGTEVNHAVLVVGYSTSGRGYWILKNSWARTWGDQGFMYLAMSMDWRGKCGIHMVSAIFPVYYPWSAQPTQISDGPVKRRDDDDGEKWWDNSGSSGSNLCSGLINPCGSGQCQSEDWDRYGRCDCSVISGGDNWVEVPGVPTSKCVPRYPCNGKNINPCGAGSCSNGPRGTYACRCDNGYVVGSTVDGLPTCVLAGLGSGSTGWGVRTYKTIHGDTCASVASAFYNTTDTTALIALNSFINCSSLLPPGVVLTLSSSSLGACASSYSVASGDTCQSIANTYFGTSLSALKQANPGLSCTNLYAAQQICVSASVQVSNVQSAICGRTVTTGISDSCSSIMSSYAVSQSNFTTLNPGLSCSSILPVGIQVCIASSNSSSIASCSAWYTAKQGDHCPSIWRAADLTEQQFLFLNPGIKCHQPFFQIGQKVCINSPALSSFSSDIIPILYTTQNGDTLASISYAFSWKCISSSVSTAKIASYNNFNNVNATSILPVGTLIQIPCSQRPGAIDCGCAPSLTVCGADNNPWPSYCDAMCNYALPAVNGACTYCQTSCKDRTGISPLNSATCGAVCPYPSWAPPGADVSLVVGSFRGMVCTYVGQTCAGVCFATKVTLGGTPSTQTANYNACMAQCTCCSRIPCAGSTCVAPASCLSASPVRCTCSGTSCTWSCSAWNSYYGVSVGNVP